MMATIVTMDSNVAVANPRGYGDVEPELVQETMHLCLDGPEPQQQQSPAFSSSEQQQPRSQQVQFVMQHGLSQRSKTNGSTATTAETSSSGGTISSLLASPVTSIVKTPLSNGMDSPFNDSQVPECASSNISLQDMFEDNDENYEKVGFRVSGEGDSFSGDFSTSRSNEMKAPELRPPSLFPSNGQLGTPPSTLYANPSPSPSPAPHNSLMYQQQSSPYGDVVASSQTSSHADSSTLSESPAAGSSLSKPMLYSAIGSLEHCSAHSLKNMWHNRQQQPKAFASTKFDSRNLIAPLNRQSNNSQSNTRESGMTYLPLLGNSSTQRPNSGTTSTASTPDKFGDSSGGNLHAQVASPLGSSGSQATPVTEHHQRAFETSFKSVQDKLDAKQAARSRGRRTQSNLQEDFKPQAAASKITKQPTASSMRKGGQSSGDKKSVKIDDASLKRKQRRSNKKKPVEMFRPSCDAYTPRMERKKITYKPAEMRTPVQKMATTMGTLSRPNFRDALRRVAMLIRQHIVKIEQRFSYNEAAGREDEGLFRMSMKEAFSEEKFATCRYKCTLVRVPMARPGMVFGLKKIRPKYEIPTEEEIYEFAHQLFKTVQLSSECSIVCLIYIERLMETSKVPLLASTWRPIFMCGLLLASKVWQDLSSWNIEFASVYPQFSLDAINKLELQFLKMVKWDLYISSSLYAKYYFALRSLVEKPDFRQRYNRMVGGVDTVAASEALKIQKRTEQVKEEALMQLSRSM